MKRSSKYRGDCSSKRGLTSRFRRREREMLSSLRLCPASDLGRCGQCRNLFRLRADADRKLDGCINHEHPATADNGCSAAGPWPWREHCQTEGWSHPGAVAPRPRGGSAERLRDWLGGRPRSPHTPSSASAGRESGPGWRWHPPHRGGGAVTPEHQIPGHCSGAGDQRRGAAALGVVPLTASR